VLGVEPVQLHLFFKQVGGALEVAGIRVVGKNRVAYTLRKPIVLAAEGR
jgi:hypothetical protein